MSVKNENNPKLTLFDVSLRPFTTSPMLWGIQQVPGTLKNLSIPNQ